MAKFIYLNDPQGATGRTVEMFDGTITEYLKKSVPHFNLDTHDVLLNEKKLELPTVENGEFIAPGADTLYCNLKDDDVVAIVNNPKGVVEVLIVVAVVAVAAVATILLTPPQTPNNQGRQVQSPNNTLSSTGQTNIARPYQAIPDIYGEPVSYPDLSGEVTQEYTQFNNISSREINQLMVIGVGVVDVTEVRTSDTELFNVGGGFNVMQPVNGETIVPEVNESFSINEVDGQYLRNEVAEDGQIYYLEDNRLGGVTAQVAVLGSPGSRDYVVTISGYNFANLDVNDFVTIRMTGTAGGLGFAYDFNSDNFLRVSARTSSQLSLVTPSPIPEEFSQVTGLDVNNIYMVSQAENTDITGGFTGTIVESTVEQVSSFDGTSNYRLTLFTDLSINYFTTFNGGDIAQLNVITRNGITTTISPSDLPRIESVSTQDGATEIAVRFSRQDSVTVPTYTQERTAEIILDVDERVAAGPFITAVEAEQIWIDYSMPRGSKQDVQLRVTYYPVNAAGNRTGPDVIVDQTINDQDSFTSRNFTYKIMTGASSRYAVSVQRTNTESEEADTPSETRLERIAAVRTLTNKNFGNVTLVQVQIPATTQPVSLRENQINCDVARRVIGYDRSTNQVDMTLRRSRDFADAILHEWVAVFNQDASLLALDELYAIQDGLSDPRLGYFDYTFDDLDISLGERVRTMANSARVFAYLEAGIWRFKRDELLASPSAVLTRRDIARDRDYSVNYKPYVGDSKDSVQVEYVDPTNNRLAYIQRRLNTTTRQIEDGVGLNPIRVEMHFCKEEFNAINRAELEIRKLIYLKTFVTDTFLSQGHVVETGDKVLYERVFNTNVIGGEVLSINGNNLRLSEPVDFTGNPSLFIVFTDDEGDASDRFAISDNTASTDPRDITIAAGSTGLYVADQIEQRRGSVYVIGTETVLDNSEYLVQSKQPSNDGRRVVLELAKADDRVYEFDATQS